MAWLAFRFDRYEPRGIDVRRREALYADMLKSPYRTVWFRVAAGVLLSPAIAYTLLLGAFALHFLPWQLASLAWIAPLMIVAVISLMGTYLFIERANRRAFEKLLIDRGLRPAVCFGCDYDLRGTPGDKCPECGRAIAPLDRDDAC